MTQAFPLKWPEGWPRTTPSKRRDYSGFRTTFSRALEQLDWELGRLGAKARVVSSWLAVRNDGLPYADQARRQIPDPGVAVYFMLRGRQMVLARDAFTTVHDNLRSIGLAIEHLRGLERHGGAPMMERAFEGFTALPNMADGHAPPSCWEILDIPPGAAREAIETKFRELAKDAHPDMGGTVELFQRIKNARDEALRQ